MSQTNNFNRGGVPRALLLALIFLALGPLTGCTEKDSKSPDSSSKSAADAPVASNDPKSPTNLSPNKEESPSAGAPAAKESTPTSAPAAPPVASTEPGVVIGRVDGMEGPIPSIHIQLQGEKLIQGKTDSAGEFVVSDVPPGDYVINAVDMTAVTSGIMRVKSRGTSVRSGEITEENFEMGFGFSVFGKVSGLKGDHNKVLVSILRDGAPDLTGSPVGDKILQYELAKHVEGSAFVKADHSFEVIDIPTGKYELRVQYMPSSDSSRSTPWSAPAVRMTIEVEDRELEQNLVLP